LKSSMVRLVCRWPSTEERGRTLWRVMTQRLRFR